ncbi:MAG: alpha/beta hydrolase [Paracoccaceae bacterium]|nr:alpha/beta hydrolase [Paracoccaceae bacterium]
MTRIYFATNRNVKHETSKNAKNFGDRFNLQGPQCFRVGRVDVALTGDPEDDEAWEVGRCELFPETLDSSMEQGAKLGSAAMFEELREFLSENICDVLIYLHGFANDFPNTARRAAALQHFYSRRARQLLVVMFSWPSNGEVLPRYQYFSDREDAEISGVAMARALKRFTEFLARIREEDRKVIHEHQREGKVPPPGLLKQCDRKLHMVAHSMGNWALRHTLVKYADLMAGKVPRIFDHAFLMAADEDADALAFTHKLGHLIDMANMVHVYHAADDRALQISDLTKGNPDRLGSDGPASFDPLPERVIAVDCEKTSFTETEHGNHQYYRLRPEVIDDVLATLRDTSQEGRRGRTEVRPGRSWRLKRARG